MRLWSIHPQYLDRRGLTALWREGLLAQKVLLGLTKGYTNHPQLTRFRATADPVLTIGCYLKAVLTEAVRRGYRFNGSKITRPSGTCRKLTVQRGQVEHEWGHLLAKLKVREPSLYKKSMVLTHPQPHPLFRIIPGGTEMWERT